MTTNTYWNNGETEPERIDHVDRSLEAIKFVEEQPGWMEYAPHATAVATAHATLALVEQQRIANLIRLNEQWENAGYGFADSVAPVLRDDVRAALGLD